MKCKVLASVIALATTSAPAAAATLFAQPASTGIQATPGSLSYTFNANAGSGSASFNLEGYITLDGEGAAGLGDPNYFDDQFTLSLNGTAIVIGKYAFGGAGTSVTTLAPTGSVINAPTTGLTRAGGSGSFLIPLALLSGTNTLTFSYNGVFQGTSDEGWGLNTVLVTGNAVTGGVPEPATWAMLMLGFGFIGAATRAGRATQRQTRIRYY